ncbi:MAG: C39 family peptidase [Candidatus Bipolaricaulaceae bacterium]
MVWVLVVALAAGGLLAGSQGLRSGRDGQPERLIITGVPPFDQPEWTDQAGKVVPAGCGPEAARMLLAYYDRRFGYRQLVREHPGQAIVELHDRMNTTTVMWQGQPQGFTDPGMFRAGLKAYVKARYVGGVELGTQGGSLSQVFAKSVQLLQANKPHIILFDWEGATWIFPNHYAVVVGYSQEAGRQQLIINPGWGYDFQILDMTDGEVAPASLVWIEAFADAPDGDPGVAIGPASAGGMWITDANGKLQLAPQLHKHFDLSTVLSWAMSDRTQFFLPESNAKIGVCTWYSD